MTNEIRAVVFDLGGVLIDWNPRYLYRKLFDGDDAAMERFLSEVCNLEWNARFDVGLPFAEGVAELVAKHPDQAELITAYRARWPEMLGGVFDQTLAIVHELKRAGLPVYALSNWSTETFAMTRAQHPFLEELDGLMISGDVGLGKPDPAIFEEFLRRFELAPRTTVFIDDWDLNVATARAAGMIAIHFADAARLRQELRALGLPVAAA